MHRTIKLRLPWARYEYDIDIGISPVIEVLWRPRISTRYCCQGDADRPASIEFWNWRDAERFVTAAGVMFDWILEPDRNIVRFPPADIPRITRELVRKAWLGLATPKCVNPKPKGAN